MKGTILQIPQLGGLHTVLPQPATSATQLQNVTVDTAYGAWSTRIGYEKIRPNPAVAFAPFAGIGRVDSLFVFDQLPTGGRTSILFEADGNLYLYYEGVTTTRVLRQIATGRTIPSPTDACSVYTVIGEYVLVTNGFETPLLVRPWPLGDVIEAEDSMSFVSRSLLYTTGPTVPRLASIATTNTSGDAWPAGDQISIFWPSQSGGIPYGGLRGLGYTYNPSDENFLESLYGWQISFVSDTGSESSLSPIGQCSWELDTNVEGLRYVAALFIPVGPRGTVARRIYRTQESSSNPGSIANLDTYYVDTVRNNIDTVYFDSTRGAALGARAPTTLERTRLASFRPRFSAIYSSCLFLDGGKDEPNALFYSYPGLPEQWSAASYVRLMGTGGSITGLFSYYNILIVLRENGLDIVSGDFDSKFKATNLTAQLACRSPSSVDAVPGVGIMFLAADGVYGLSGGFEGGAQVTLTKMSASIQPIIDRITPDCASRAVARYCPLTMEYHLYFAADGYSTPTLGLVYHVEKQAWSIREGFPVGALDRLYSGELIFGHGDGAGPKSPAAETGLFIISARRALGGFLNGNDFVYRDPPVSKYRSCWHNFGGPSVEKQVQYVTLWVVTTGTVAIRLKHLKDFKEVAVAEQAYYSQPPDDEFQPVFDTALLDTAEWSDGRLVPIRVAVHEMSCANFAFEFTTSDDLLFLGYDLEYTVRGTRVIEGKRA